MLTALTAAALLWMTQPASTAPPEAPAAVVTDQPLSHFDDLIGSWTTPGDGPPMQETWMPAQGNNITGVLRWYAEDGTVRMYELMTITAEPDAVRLRIRHFDKHMNPWSSETEGPMVLRLVPPADTDTALVFRAEARAGSVETITYELGTPGHAAVTLGFKGDQPATTIGFVRMTD